MKEQLFEILKVRRDVVYGDIPGLIADIEHLVNQEVERRIKERMPSEEEQDKWADRVAGNTTSDHSKAVVYKAALSLGATWLRSRLTQKTEGGGE